MTTSIELHGAKTGNCLRVSIALEETGLPYTVKLVDLHKGEQRASPYLAINPAGQVPTIIDRSTSGPEFVLSQSNAIMLYVDERARGHLLPRHDPHRLAIAYERFFYFITDVIAANHAAFHLRGDNEHDSASFFDRRALAALTASERFLAVPDVPYMAGDDFSLADIAGFTIAFAMKSHVAWDRFPLLHQWFQRVVSRPCVQRGLRAFDRMST